MIPISDEFNSDQVFNTNKNTKNKLKSTNYQDTNEKTNDACNLKKKRLSKKMWTEEEDALLKKIVEEQGASRWKHISKFIPGRNDKQCRERYLEMFSPKVRREEWTPYEDNMLINMQNVVGNHWSIIASHIIGRTPIMVKNRFRLLKRRENSKLSSLQLQSNECIPKEESFNFEETTADIDITDFYLDYDIDSTLFN